VDIQSDAEFAQAEAEAAFAGGAENEEFSGRCVAILANGKRCPNTALPGSRFCGIAAHRELAEREAAGEELEASQVVGGVSEEAEEEAPADAVAEEAPGDAEAQDEVAAEAPLAADEAPAEEPAAEVTSEPEDEAEEAEPEVEEPQEAPVEPEVPVAVEDAPAAKEEDRPSAA
jgi:transcription termination/antitermination protein NusA